MLKEGLIISKKPLDDLGERYSGVFEYWIRLKDKKIKTLNIRSDKLKINQRVEIEIEHEDEKEKVRFKRII